MFWRKKKPSPAEAPDPYFELQPYLVRLLEGHGVPVTTYGHWVLSNNELPALRAYPYQPNPHANGTTRQIDIELKLNNDTTVVECYGGLGSTPEKVLNDVLMTFCVGTMHVYLSAFWSKHEPDQVEIETWDANGSSWLAFVGNSIFKMSNGTLQPKLPDGYLQTVKDHICSLPLSGDYHWASLFLYRLHKEITAEMQVDNQISEDLNAKMKSLSWEKTEGFYSSRTFILLKRQPATGS